MPNTLPFAQLSITAIATHAEYDVDYTQEQVDKIASDTALALRKYLWKEHRLNIDCG